MLNFVTKNSVSFLVFFFFFTDNTIKVSVKTGFKCGVGFAQWASEQEMLLVQQENLHALHNQMGKFSKPWLKYDLHKTGTTM